MPKFPLSHAPIALACLEKSDTELAALFRMSAMTIDGDVWLINICRDESKKSEKHWIEIDTNSSQTAHLLIRIFIENSCVEFNYKQNRIEKKDRINHPCLILNNISNITQQIPTWLPALQAIDSIWDVVLLNFRIATEQRKTHGTQSPREFRTTLTGRPAGSRVRERLPIDFWDLNPVISWPNSRIELPSADKKSKVTVWSDVGVEVDGANQPSGIALKRRREDQCRKWLEAEAKLHPRSPRLKAQYLEEAKSAIPFLKEAEFSRAWRAVCAEMQKDETTRWGLPGAPRR